MRKSREIKWYSTIKTKLLVAILVTITMVMGVAGFSAYKYIQKSERASLEKLAEVSASRLSRHLILPMWGLDREQVSYLLTAEMEEQRISAIVIRDQDGKSVFAAKKRALDGSVVDAFGNINGDLVNVDREVVHNGQTIGVVNIFITPEFMKKELSQFGKAVFIIVVILNVVIGLMRILLFGHLVTRPLSILTLTAERISTGDLSQEVKINSRDEIGYLAETLVRMQTSMAIAVRRIKESRG